MIGIDLFAGVGGWEVGGDQQFLGFELDPVVIMARERAGLVTVPGDLRGYRPPGWGSVLVGSPPCQRFSQAGRGEGRSAFADITRAITRLGRGQRVRMTGDRLVAEPLRWALEAMDQGNPFRTICLEQVPTVLPIWAAVAGVLSERGYSVLTGKINSEQYGVPQTRTRAVMIARLGAEAVWPKPTHSRFYPRSPGRLDPDVAPWVSMGEALDYPHQFVQEKQTGQGGLRGRTTPWARRDDQPSFTVTGMSGGGSVRLRMRSNYGTGGDPRDRGERTIDQPAPTVTSKIDRNRWLIQSARARATIRSLDEPAPSIMGGLSWGERRWLDSKPPTSGRVRLTGGIPADSVRVSLAEAAIFQTFPPDYPFTGTQTQQFGQVGNAIPPVLARAILAPNLPE